MSSRKLSPLYYNMELFLMVVVASLSVAGTLGQSVPGECSLQWKLKYLQKQRDLHDCGYVSKNEACFPGFYQLISSNGSAEVRVCDAGWLCPAEFVCKIKCPGGAYCPSPVWNPATKRCDPYDRLPYQQVNSPYDGICGGAFNLTYCPGGYYCSSSDQKKKCPDGYYCMTGSEKPVKCSGVAHCPSGTDWPTSWGLALLIFFIGIVLPLCACKAIHYVHARNLKKRSAITGLLYQNSKEFGEHGGDDLEQRLPSRPRMSFASFADGAASIIKTPLPESYNLDNVSPRTDRLLNELMLEETVAAARTEKNFRMNIQFIDLGLILHAGKRKVLQNVSGRLRSGHLTAIMGPSGSGKTSLLNALANKANYGTVTGSIFVNGKKEDNLEDYSLLTGFVPQEDIMHHTLTVEETLMFYANLRLPSVSSRDQRRAVVDNVIDVLSLSDIRHSRIGDSMKRGISGGQRKRVNIGMELVNSPSILFCDEPTSGLDSTSSFDVIEALSQVANTGVNVIVVLHQPRTEIFKMFDDVVLLVSGGRSVFIGPRAQALPYFKQMGYECQSDVNPADFLIDTISGRVLPKEPFSVLGADDLVSSWSKEYSSLHDQLSREFSTYSGQYMTRVPPGFWMQLWYFIRRWFILMFRSPVTIFLDFALVGLAGLCLGSMFHSRTLDDTTSIFLLTSMTIGLTTMLTSVRFLGNDKYIYYREADMGINSLSYYLAANFANDVIHALAPACFLGTFYVLVTPRASFLQLYGILLAGIAAISGFSQFISVIFSQKNMQLAGVVSILLLNMVGGTNPTICSLNDINFISLLFVNVSYARFLIDALVITEWENWPPVYKYHIDEMTEHYCFNEYGMLWNIVALLIIGFLFRILAFIGMITIVPDRRQSLANFKKLIFGLSLCIGISILIAGSVVGIVYLVLGTM